MAKIVRILANFERIHDREDLCEWRTRGVYVNLGRNPVRTARVGEGWVDARAKEQWSRRDEHVIACDLGVAPHAKSYAEIVECLILSEFEYRMGRLPSGNRRGGKTTVLARCLDRCDVIQLRIKGCSPLNGRRLASSIDVEIELADGGFAWWWC